MTNINPAASTHLLRKIYKQARSSFLTVVNKINVRMYREILNLKNALVRSACYVTMYAIFSLVHVTAGGTYSDRCIVNGDRFVFRVSCVTRGLVVLADGDVTGLT